MKSKVLAILFSMVLLLMSFSVAAAGSTLDEFNEPAVQFRADVCGYVYGDQLYSLEATSLNSRISISGADYWSLLKVQLCSLEATSLNSRISIAGADYWSFFKDQPDSQEGVNSRYSISSGDYWGVTYGDQLFSEEGVALVSQFSKSSGDYWANLP